MLDSNSLSHPYYYHFNLCNLHNEVFEVAETRINTECSLTASEGILQVISTCSNLSDSQRLKTGACFDERK